MFHLNRLYQHTIKVGTACDPHCLVCPTLTNTKFLDLDLEALPNIINIIAPSNDTCIPTLLDQIHLKKSAARIWVNHKFSGLDPTGLTPDDAVFVWCPGPHKQLFNDACNEDYFDEFKQQLCRFKCKKTVVLMAKQLNLDALPEFYDVITECQSEGLIMYYPKEFTKNERAYIKRFNRVKNMFCMPLPNRPCHAQMGVPSTIGTFAFNRHDWWHCVIRSCRSMPFVRSLFLS